MKLLTDILSSIKPESILGDQQKEVVSICIDSRLVQKGSMFVALVGTSHDGHEYINEVIAKGAHIIVCQQKPSEILNEVTYIVVKDTAHAVGNLCSSFFDYPSSKLKVVGVTGTNGKTTCATLMFQLFSQLSYTCGLISTVQNQIGQEILTSTHTTPDAVQLQQLMALMVERGCEYIFMEVSSHAIHQQRIAGVVFAVACFTNITHDHLDYHHSFDEYIRVKKLFFDQLPKEAIALVNIDDKRGLIMQQNTQALKKTYSLLSIADYKGKIIENNLSGLFMQFNQHEVYCRMIGEFNAYNLLCVYGMACELGQDKEIVLQILSTLQGAEGRFDCIQSEKEHILGIVDYAHTPDALLNVLATINKLRKGNETVFTIVGCGGDRDKAKRPIMALVACEHSNRVIFTSDNPRSENPSTILAEMEAGVPVHQRKKYVCIADRKEAIKTACSISEEGDIILIAGKGHEKYQEMNGIKTPFDDKQILKDMFDIFQK